MTDFLIKTEKWAYQKEHRLFGKPGIHSAAKEGINLKAILYTTCFDQNNIEALKNINDKYYDNKLHLQEIYPTVNRHTRDDIKFFGTFSKTTHIDLKKWIIDKGFMNNKTDFKK